MSTSASSKSLNGSLRQPPLEQHQHAPQPVRDAAQYGQRLSQEHARPMPGELDFTEQPTVPWYELP